MEFLVSQFVPTISCTGRYWAESGSVLFTPPSGIYIHCEGGSTGICGKPTLFWSSRWTGRDRWTRQNTLGLLKWQDMPMCGPLNQKGTTTCVDCMCRLYCTCMLAERWCLVLFQVSLNIQGIHKELTDTVKLWETLILLEKRWEAWQDRWGCLKCLLMLVCGGLNHASSVSVGIKWQKTMSWLSLCGSA